MLDIFKERDSTGMMVWSFRRVSGALAVVAAVVAGVIGKDALMAAAFAYAGSAGISLGISEAGKGA